MLKDLGIPMQSVCNMAAIASEILAVPVNQAKTVVEYCKQREITGNAVVEDWLCIRCGVLRHAL